MAEIFETCLPQRCRQPAQRPKPGLRPIRQAGKASLGAPAHHDSLTLSSKRGGNPINQPGTFEKRLCLVAAKAPRLPSGKDSPQQNQSNASVATPSAL